MAAVTVRSDFGAQENKICHSFHFSPFYLWWSDGTDAMVLVFLNVEFQDSFCGFPLSLSSRGSLVPLHFLPLLWYHLHIWGYWYFSWQSWFQLVLHPAQHFTWCTLHISWISRVTIYSLDVLLSQFGTHLFYVLFCCFLTCIQISQEAGQMVWYSHLFKNVQSVYWLSQVGLLSAKEKKEMRLLSSIRLFVTPWTVVCQAPLSMGFSRQD